MDEVNIPELVAHLNSPDDAVRKKAAFRLQAPISEPSFADHFESAGGLTALRLLALNATGNTLAYTLASFEKSLELDHGWEYVDHRLIERVRLCLGRAAGWEEGDQREKCESRREQIS